MRQKETEAQEKNNIRKEESALIPHFFYIYLSKTTEYLLPCRPLLDPSWLYFCYFYNDSFDWNNTYGTVYCSNLNKLKYLNIADTLKFRITSI